MRRDGRNQRRIVAFGVSAVLVDAHVGTECDRPAWTVRKPGEIGVEAGVVETHAVDHCLIRDQAKQSRAWVASLWSWRDGAGLNEAEPQSHQRRYSHRVLVESCGQADRVVEPPAQHVDGQTLRIWSACSPAEAEAQSTQGQHVGALRIEPSHERHEGGCDCGRHRRGRLCLQAYRRESASDVLHLAVVAHSLSRA